MKNRILVDIKYLQLLKDVHSELGTRIKMLSNQKTSHNVKIKSLKQAQQEILKEYTDTYDKAVISMDELDLDTIWKNTILNYYKDINQGSFINSQAPNREYTGFEVTSSNANKALRNSWFRLIEHNQ